MIKIKDGEIIQYNLPRVGILSTGETVSGYNLLSEEILQNEGWLPLEDNPPEYDMETQYLVTDEYEILEDKVIAKYKIENIPILEEIENDTFSNITIEELKQEIKLLSDVLDFIVQNGGVM